MRQKRFYLVVLEAFTRIFLSRSFFFFRSPAHNKDPHQISLLCEIRLVRIIFCRTREASFTLQGKPLTVHLHYQVMRMKK